MRRSVASTPGSPGARRNSPSYAARTRSRSCGRQFATPKFGAGRNVRFGDLDGDGTPDMLIAQNIPRIRRHLRRDQLPDGGHARRQGPLAARPARPAERPADQRHALPDPRPRRRRQERGRAGQGLQAPGPGRATGKVRKSVPMPADAAGTTERSPTTLTKRRLPSPSSTSSGKPAATARSWSRTATRTSGSRQRPEAALEGRGADRALSPTRSTSTATAATRSPSATRSGTTPGSSSGATTRT